MEGSDSSNTSGTDRDSFQEEEQAEVGTGDQANHSRRLTQALVDLSEPEYITIKNEYDRALQALQISARNVKEALAVHARDHDKKLLASLEETDRNLSDASTSLAPVLEEFGDKELAVEWRQGRIAEDLPSQPEEYYLSERESAYYRMSSELKDVHLKYCACYNDFEKKEEALNEFIARKISGSASNDQERTRERWQGRNSTIDTMKSRFDSHESIMHGLAPNTTIEPATAREPESPQVPTTASPSIASSNVPQRRPLSEPAEQRRSKRHISRVNYKGSQWSKCLLIIELLQSPLKNFSLPSC